ncbi:adenosylmethionine--8-amino-7-oxononanoate transaminase [Winogradskyella haliclonae]|uniref:Adenosylmethionine-8-amino-7-oxononanoate aminotransferase n=1 Tax=Winogradskyella haliclonae TaxID=2048558 RepID=A0ABQ2BVG2_9FLAO|nr:adenosylmethionine--8-amino-7-oxononanoate transaminase [Winogradskyella haliclonae]GGI56481.1 adenosylmethionine--8-amino-7-oxononanoate aminotransferase BioA [Winogradskyella haliclonae]
MTLKERDKKHLWHPLKQHQTHPESLAIVKAKGCILTDEDGNEYIDAISSWYTCMFGHCNHYIVDKVSQQMRQLDQIMFSDFTHEPAVKLSEELIKILPQGQAKIFFNDNGSTAVEAGIKMALQYYYNKGEKRSTFIAFENGFHGDTFGAMSVSGLSVYNGPFEDFLIDVKRIPTPDGTNHLSILKQLETYAKDFGIAGFIYEPLVQGAAGMKIHNAEGLNQILKFCKDKHILTIADEVMTGFGKTGKNFASDYIDTKPDIICLSKALTAGLVPMAITSCTQDIYDAFLSNEMVKGFFHCHTYSANPIACSAAIATIELLTSKEIKHSISRISKMHQHFSERISKHPKVKSTRHIGVIFALDLDINVPRYGDLRDKLLKFFMDNGVFLRPLGNTIYIQPPYIISESELEKVYHTIETALDTL